MKQFIAEVPRFFTYLNAGDEKEAKELLYADVKKLIDGGHAKISDVTDVPKPTAAEASASPKKSEWHRIMSIIETGRAVVKTMGGHLHLGIGNGDIMVGSELAGMLGLPVPDDASAVSLGGIFSTITTDKTNVA
jgi:hypothetical protein